MCGRRVPAGSRRAQKFNFRCADACTQTQLHVHKRTHTDVDKRRGMLTNADTCKILQLRTFHVICLGLESLPANLCPMLVTFKNQKYSWHSINHFQNPTHRPELTYPWKPSLILEYVLLRGLGYLMVFISRVDSLSLLLS